MSGEFTLLSNNYRPLHGILGDQTLAQRFDYLFPKSKAVNIATGFISEESVIHLARMIDKNKYSPDVNLIIGMHKFEGMTRSQKEATNLLKDVLKEKGKGRVYLHSAYPFHGKFYAFDGKERPTAIVGSSNLSAIVQGPRQFEVDVEFTGSKARDMFTLFDSMMNKTSIEYAPDLVETIDRPNDFMEGIIGVERVPLSETKVSSWDIAFAFEIPLKCTGKSNLNVHNGRGRVQKNGFVLPRDWFETEFIVSNSITSSPGYPSDQPFQVVTDDGYTFSCQTSGSNGKNFRSSGDLKTLGRWLKGRLQSAGALAMGETVSPNNLEKYGRDTVSLIKSKNSDKWHLDFSV